MTSLGIATAWQIWFSIARSFDLNTGWWLRVKNQGVQLIIRHYIRHFYWLCALIILESSDVISQCSTIVICIFLFRIIFMWNQIQNVARLQTWHALCGYYASVLQDKTPSNSMEQSPSWEANRSSARQKIPRILPNPELHDRIYNQRPLVQVLSQSIQSTEPSKHDKGYFLISVTRWLYIQGYS